MMHFEKDMLHIGFLENRGHWLVFFLNPLPCGPHGHLPSVPIPRAELQQKPVHSIPCKCQLPSVCSKPVRFGLLIWSREEAALLSPGEARCGLARTNTIMKVNRKKWGPGAIPGSWQSCWIGSAPPMKTAARSKLNLLSAISLSFPPFLFGLERRLEPGPWQLTEVLQGESIYLQWVVAMLVQDAVSCRKLCPHPRVWSFLQKKKKKSLIVWGLNSDLEQHCVTCLYLEGLPSAPM